MKISVHFACRACRSVIAYVADHVHSAETPAQATLTALEEEIERIYTCPVCRKEEGWDWVGNMPLWDEP